MASNPSSGSVIDLRGVRASSAHARLIDVSLRVDAGELVVIRPFDAHEAALLLSIISLHRSEWSGHYYFDRIAVHSLAPAERESLRRMRIGCVHASAALVDGLTVRENVEIPLTWQRMTGADRLRIVDRLLERLDLSSIADEDAGSLSPLDERLVAFAKAVVARPRLVIAEIVGLEAAGSRVDAALRHLGELAASGTAIVCTTSTVDPLAEVSARYQLANGQLEPQAVAV